jgi:hypothetical protein
MRRRLLRCGILIRPMTALGPHPDRLIGRRMSASAGCRHGRETSYTILFCPGALRRSRPMAQAGRNFTSPGSARLLVPSRYSGRSHPIPAASRSSCIQKHPSTLDSCARQRPPRHHMESRLSRSACTPLLRSSAASRRRGGVQWRPYRRATCCHSRTSRCHYRTGGTLSPASDLRSASLRNEWGPDSYGPNPIDPFRQGASYVDRILKGAKPGDLPAQFPTKYELVINLKHGGAVGLDVLVEAQAADKTTERDAYLRVTLAT